MILITSQLPFTVNGKGILMDDAVRQLENDENGVRVLSWNFDFKKKGILREVNLMKWNPTIIALQNITMKDYTNLKQENSFLDTYEESGIDLSQNMDEETICNPILFKGHRFTPVKEEEKFTGEYRKKSGQISWSQLKLVHRVPEREKRDLPSDGVPINKLEFFFNQMNKYGDEGCKNVKGSIIFINANLKEDENLGEDLKDVLNDIYKNVMCRRAKKIILTGNVGWLQSTNVISNFRRRRNEIPFFKRNGINKQQKRDIWNVNQIWSRDYQGILGTSSDILEYEGTELKKDIEGHEKAAVAPSFAAFHQSMMRRGK